MGKKSHKKPRFIFIRNCKGQKDQNTMRERGEKRGRSGGGEGGEDRGNPVSNQASGGCREETSEKWASVPNCDKRQASQKTNTTHTPHQDTHKYTPQGLLRAGHRGAAAEEPDPALARRDTMCSNYAIRENSKRSSRALSTVTFILYFCKDLVPGCG